MNTPHLQDVSNLKPVDHLIGEFFVKDTYYHRYIILIDERERNGLESSLYF